MPDKEYEMPDDYQRALDALVKMIAARDRFARDIPNLPFADRRFAQPKFQQLVKSIENLEQKLAEEYDRYQREQREWEADALADPDEGMSVEHFIRVKHLQPELFKLFNERVTGAMTADERAAHETAVASREACDLEGILSGAIPVPVFENRFIKLILPDETIPEYLLNIALLAYETDDFFENSFVALKRGREVKRSYNFGMSRAVPVRRRLMERNRIELIAELDVGSRFLLEYFEERRRDGTFQLREKHYAERLAAEFQRLADHRARKSLLIKHTMPDAHESYECVVRAGLNDEEIAAYDASIAAVTDADVMELIESLNIDKASAAEFAAQTASGEKRIEGGNLSVEQWERIAGKPDRTLPNEDPSDTLDYDLPSRYDQYWRAFNAVTGDVSPLTHYEDAQSAKDAKITEAVGAATRAIEKLFIIIKYQTPHKFAEFEKISTEMLLPSEKVKFYDRIAKLEATQLDEILAGK